jgi:hypothetical protein
VTTSPYEPAPPDATDGEVAAARPAVPAPRAAGAYPTGTLSRSLPESEEAPGERTLERAQVAEEIAASAEAAARADAVPGVLARAAVDTRPTARPDALPAPSAPPRRPGTLYYSGRRPSDRGRRMSRLQVGMHTATPAALDQLAPPSPVGGLLIGMDRQQQPVMLRLFQPRPTNVVVVGRDWAAGILAFRAVGMGARALVVGGHPDAWQRLGATVVAEDGAPPASAPDRPVLLVRREEAGVDGPPGAPWQARVTLVPRVDAVTEAAVADADLVLSQRLEAREARALGRLRRLGPGQWEPLSALEPEMMGLLAGGAFWSVWLRPTLLERQLLGLSAQ